MSPFRKYRTDADPTPFIGALRKMSFHADQMHGFTGGVQRLRQVTPDGEVILTRVNDMDIVDIFPTATLANTFVLYIMNWNEIMFSPENINFGSIYKYNSLGINDVTLLINGIDYSVITENPIKIHIKKPTEYGYQILMTISPTGDGHAYQIDTMLNKNESISDAARVYPGTYNVKARWADSLTSTRDANVFNIINAQDIPQSYYDAWWIYPLLSPGHLLWSNYYKVIGEYLKDNPSSDDKPNCVRLSGYTDYINIIFNYGYWPCYYDYDHNAEYPLNYPKCSRNEASLQCDYGNSEAYPLQRSFGCQVNLIWFLSQDAEQHDLTTNTIGDNAGYNITDVASGIAWVAERTLDPTMLDYNRVGDSGTAGTGNMEIADRLILDIYELLDEEGAVSELFQLPDVGDENITTQENPSAYAPAKRMIVDDYIEEGAPDKHYKYVVSVYDAVAANYYYPLYSYGVNYITMTALKNSFRR
jgi:hypothetical protein